MQIANAALEMKHEMFMLAPSLWRASLARAIPRAMPGEVKSIKSY
jgi:hypothetical protein